MRNADVLFQQRQQDAVLYSSAIIGRCSGARGRINPTDRDHSALN